MPVPAATVAAVARCAAVALAAVTVPSAAVLAVLLVITAVVSVGLVPVVASVPTLSAWLRLEALHLLLKICLLRTLGLESSRAAGIQAQRQATGVTLLRYKHTHPPTEFLLHARQLRSLGRHGEPCAWAGGTSASAKERCGSCHGGAWASQALRSKETTK